MKRAIISDIHGNLEALQSVLEDIRLQGVTEIYCLGDIVGYGPNPCECIDLMSNVDACILGNHDQATLFDPDGFNRIAEQAIFWTRSELETSGTPEQIAKRWEFLGELQRNKREDKFLFVHGSARNPLNEYVFAEDIYNNQKMDKIFSVIEQYCFQGHTHWPGVFTRKEFFTPNEINNTFQLGEEKLMINVGSVGQPRDSDPRSCYVILEDDIITYRRIEYPVEVTVNKIYDIQGLDAFLGTRLRTGI